MDSVTECHTHDEVTLDALGNPVRRQILHMLARGPRAVGNIAAELPVSRPAVSKHLQILQGAALVTHDRQGSRHLFRLNPEGFETAIRCLDAFWDNALARFVMVAENLSGDRR